MIHRHRTDKDHGNGLKTAISVKLSIDEPVSQLELSEVCQSLKEVFSVPMPSLLGKRAKAPDDDIENLSDENKQA